MAELLIKAEDNQLYRKGYIIVIKDSPAVWGSMESLPKFVRIVVDDADASELAYLRSENVMHDFTVRKVSDKIEILPKSVTGSNQNRLDTKDRTEIGIMLQNEFGVSAIDISNANKIEFDAGSVDVAELEASLIDRYQREYSKRRYYVDPIEIDKLVLVNKNQVKWTKAALLALIGDRMLD